MGRHNKCWVPFCNSIRASSHGLLACTEKLSFFKPPKNEEMLAAWKKQIPASEALTSECTLCERHFDPEDIVRYFEHSVDGEIVRIRRQKPSLKKGAVPLYFQNGPDDSLSPSGGTIELEGPEIGEEVETSQRDEVQSADKALDETSLRTVEKRKDPLVRKRKAPQVRKRKDLPFKKGKDPPVTPQEVRTHKHPLVEPAPRRIRAKCTNQFALQAKCTEETSRAVYETVRKRNHLEVEAETSQTDEVQCADQCSGESYMGTFLEKFPRSIPPDLDKNPLRNEVKCTNQRSGAIYVGTIVEELPRTIPKVKAKIPQRNDEVECDDQEVDEICVETILEELPRSISRGTAKMSRKNEARCADRQSDGICMETVLKELPRTKDRAKTRRRNEGKRVDQQSGEVYVEESPRSTAEQVVCRPVNKHWSHLKLMNMKHTIAYGLFSLDSAMEEKVQLTCTRLVIIYTNYIRNNCHLHISGRLFDKRTIIVNEPTIAALLQEVENLRTCRGIGVVDEFHMLNIKMPVHHFNNAMFSESCLATLDSAQPPNAPRCIKCKYSRKLLINQISWKNKNNQLEQLVTSVKRKLVQ